jgi:hypothetical protein
MRALVGTFAALVLAAPARAVPDHLKCYTIKDSAPHTSYRADLTGIVTAPGCLIKVPGKLVCVASEKTNVVPAPPGAPAGNAVGGFVCYAVKCSSSAPPNQAFVDQFGNRTMRPSGANYLCAPASVGMTTTTTSTSTTTTLPGPCGDDPLCNGTCPSGQGCALDPSNGCQCFTSSQCIGQNCFSGSCPGHFQPCPPGYGTCMCSPSGCACTQAPSCGTDCACPAGGACVVF